MIALATVHVHCYPGAAPWLEELHRVSIMKNGRLHFYDHDQSLWLIDELIQAAGDDPPLCRCAAILRWWRLPHHVQKVPTYANWIPAELRHQRSSFSRGAQNARKRLLRMEKS